MIFKKTMLAAVVTLGTIAGAHAAVEPAAPGADQGHGKVTFTGSIIDAPCSIDPKSIDQTVELGAVSNVSLLNGGNSDPKPFEIHLEKCSLETAKTVTTLFDGPKDEHNMLGMTGDAKGAGIIITDGSNNVIEMGKATQGQLVSAGAQEATLAFSAYLKGNGETVNPGKFQSVTNFILSYK